MTFAFTLEAFAAFWDAGRSEKEEEEEEGWGVLLFFFSVLSLPATHTHTHVAENSVRMLRPLPPPSISSSLFL